MGLNGYEQNRIKLILAKDGTQLRPSTLAAMTGYDAKNIRDWLRNERKKERRRRGDNPDKNRSEQYRERKRSRERVEAWDELIARLLKDRPPDRDPAEHERIVRMNFADMC